MTRGYVGKWKPSKKAVKKWLDEIQELEADESIQTSKNSAYFKIREVEYRVSGHSPFAASNNTRRNSQIMSEKGILTEEGYKKRLEKEEGTINSVKTRVHEVVQIQAAHTKAKEIKEAIEEGSFDFDTARYYNRKEAMKLLEEHGELSANTKQNTTTNVAETEEEIEFGL